MFAVLGRSAAHGVTWARARRDLDMAAAPAAGRELTNLLGASDGADRVLVHLGVACFVDLYGLRVLVDVDARLRRRGGELVVVDPPRSLRTMVEVTGLGADITLAPIAPRAARRARPGGGAPGGVPRCPSVREGQP